MLRPADCGAVGIRGLTSEKGVNRLNREFLDRNTQRVTEYVPRQHTGYQHSAKCQDPGQGRRRLQGTKTHLLVKIGTNPSPDWQRSIVKEALAERIGLAGQLARKADARGET